MSIIKNTILLLFLVMNFTSLHAQEIKKIGKFKDWETIVVSDDSAKLCFAQSKPVLQSPKNNLRDARLFISFRPAEKITDEVSITSGYEYNVQNTIYAKSGKNKIKFDQIIDEVKNNAEILDISTDEGDLEDIFLQVTNK